MTFSDPDPTFQLASDHTEFFFYILDINFTFVFLMTRNKLFKGIFFYEKDLYFKIEHFC
jgi:hypothetical protein